MELAFDKLIEFNIKRLTRPKFKHEFAQFNDPVLLQSKPDPQPDTSLLSEQDDELTPERKFQLWKDQGAMMNDVAYDGISSDQGLSYQSSFGKIFKGEQFKTVLTIMNTSSIYTLEKLTVRVYVERPNTKQLQIRGSGEVILLEQRIDSLGARAQKSFPLTF